MVNPSLQQQQQQLQRERKQGRLTKMNAQGEAL